ncbi:amidase signature domain-containing protein [Flammula alnicola]|nr:amidase signature domain-containing protein [Flammula alnicola]
MHTAGTVFSFPGQPEPLYLAASQPLLKVYNITPSISGEPPFVLIPATSVWIKDNYITKESLQSQLTVYGTFDDVWTEGFMGCLVISYEGKNPTSFGSTTFDWLRSQGVSRVFISGSFHRPANEIIPIYSMVGTVRPGPFVISHLGDGTIGLAFQNVYRLYLDEYEAFLFGAIPDFVNGGWILTNITHTRDDESYSQFIPVPSRLTISNMHLPLAGTRFGLKDIYDARGLPTAAGSIAYQLTHDTPTKTAPSIEKLLALGATMVGKTRTSQFAHGAQPWEFVDVPYSWNPRGDGHLTASASSSGSACAIAAYDWLDFTVGSDTRGSVRKPASLVGAYGIRPSHGSMDLTGVVPLSEEMDTAGFFARHPKIFHEVASRWYAASPVANRLSTTRFPSKLLYPIDHFPVKSQEAQMMIDNFVEALQYHLGISAVRVNFTETLAPFLPNESFPDFQLSSNKLAEYRSWEDVGRPTTQEFMSRFGRSPVFDPIPEKMFTRAQSITDDDFADSVALKRAFRDALSEHVFKHDEESCSDTLFMYDAATGGIPSYRVEEFNHLSGATPFLLTAVGADRPAKLSDFFNFLASMGELPEVTIPIGQASYFSPLSRAWEPIPVAIELIARKGCDQMLLDLVKNLAELGVIGPVKVGRSMF